MLIYTTFDIADQSFSFYNETQWDDYMFGLREDLRENFDEDLVDNMDWHELLEYTYGEEMFWDCVDSSYVKN